jgi:hypothetical protein
MPGVVGSGKHVLRCLVALYEATSAQVHGRPPPAGQAPAVEDWSKWARWSVEVFAAIVTASFPNLEGRDRECVYRLLPKNLESIRVQ